MTIACGDILDQTGAYVLDEAGAFIWDELGPCDHGENHNQPFFASLGAMTAR